MTECHSFTKDDAIRFADEHSGLFGEHSKLSCDELGDNNLSLLFRVSNDKGRSLIVKQAMGHVHIASENWQLTPDRARIEAEVLIKHRKLCPEHTIEVLHCDSKLAAILLEDLKDYRNLTTELISTKQFTHLAPQLATYLARTLYFTSDFALTGPNKKQQVGHFLNPELCLVTEDLSFTDPYCNHERNNVHAEISADAQQLWHDDILQAEVAKLKADFLSKPQAVLHGNLNTSVVGLVHAVDIEHIGDENLRAKTERAAITLGRELILQRYNLANIDQVLILIKHLKL